MDLWKITLLDDSLVTEDGNDDLVLWLSSSMISASRILSDVSDPSSSNSMKSLRSNVSSPATDKFSLILNFYSISINLS